MQLSSNAYCATVGLAVESANIVGYGPTETIEGGISAGASFVPVSGSTIDLADLTVTGYEDPTGEDVEVQTLDEYGATDKSYIWKDITFKGIKYYGWTMIVTTKVNGDDYLFISDALTKSRQADGKNTKITFSLYDASSAAVLQAAGGYAGAGWYSAVPEPTSGLLVLLGVAGLALKRRHA